MAHPVDILVSGLILCGAGCCVLAVYSAAELAQLRSNGAKATAAIAGFNQVHESQRRTRTGTARYGARRDRLRFEVDGKPVIFSADVSGSAELIGEMTVLYDRDNPQTACVAPCDTSTGIYLAGGLGLLLFGGGLWARQRIQREDAESLDSSNTE